MPLKTIIFALVLAHTPNLSAQLFCHNVFNSAIKYDSIFLEQTSKIVTTRRPVQNEVAAQAVLLTAKGGKTYLILDNYIGAQHRQMIRQFNLVDPRGPIAKVHWIGVLYGKQTRGQLSIETAANYSAYTEVLVQQYTNHKANKSARPTARSKRPLPLSFRDDVELAVFQALKQKEISIENLRYLSGSVTHRNMRVVQPIGTKKTPIVEDIIFRQKDIKNKMAIVLNWLFVRSMPNVSGASAITPKSLSSYRQATRDLIQVIEFYKSTNLREFKEDSIQTLDATLGGLKLLLENSKMDPLAETRLQQLLLEADKIIYQRGTLPLPQVIEVDFAY